MKYNQPMKNVVIFGDSYSTFAGYVPEGYAVYYSQEGRPETDVRRVEETWWHALCTDRDLNLVLNNSWSGSTLCYTGYDGDCSETSSFICRMEKLAREDFFAKNKIDSVFIFGCTDDSWSNAPLGEIKLCDYARDDLFCVCPAIGYFVGRLRELLPNGNIVFVMNTALKPEIDAAIKASCEHYGAEYVELYRIDKDCGHPTIKGMAEIKAQIEAFLDA